MTFPSYLESALAVLYDKQIIGTDEYNELVSAEKKALAVAKESGFEQAYRDEQREQFVSALRKLVGEK